MSQSSELLTKARAELSARCNAVEEAYEFMLAYAGQGLANEAGSAKGGQVREYLAKAEAALSGLSTVVASFAGSANDPALAPYAAFMDVIDRDARAARGRKERHDHRGPLAGWLASAAEGVGGIERSAMRVLPDGSDHDRGGAPGEEAEADGAGNR